VFALCLASDDTHIGNLSLFNVNYINRNAGLTIFIADETHRGNGYGTNSVQLLCAYGFDYLNLHRIYCKTNNPVAGKMYEKLGFNHEGVLREQSFRRGKYVDKQLYGLLRGELTRLVDTTSN
jgi:RimJ/RimL family protein N-acetyltransferase